MRVVAGVARGVPLVAPPGRATRPTADRTKEAIFDILGELGCEGRVLDLFAGSGALGIEALSRGASCCDFVESSPAACRAIAANLEKTKLSSFGCIQGLPVDGFIRRATRAGSEPYDLILMDPPYALPELDTVLAALAASPLVGPRTVLLVEHNRRRSLPPLLGVLRLVKRRQHGDSACSLYLPATGDETGLNG